MTTATNDTILLDGSATAFDELVREALEAYRDGRLVALGEGPLAGSSLAAPALLVPRPDAAARGRALAAVLRWVVDQLRPDGARDWLDRRWQDHNILRAYYLEGWRLADVAEALGYSDIHLAQSLRPRAVAAAGQILRTELAAPGDADGRRRYAVAGLYERYTAGGQRVLRLLACFEAPIPTALLYQLTGEAELPANLARLVHDQLLVQSEQGVALLAPLRDYLALQVTPDERRRWLAAAGAAFEAQGRVLRAARCWRRGGAAETAVRLLIDRWKELVDQGDEAQSAALQQQLVDFTAAELAAERAADLWPQLKLAAGRVAEFRGDLAEARRQYEQALVARAAAIKAAAYHRLAELFKRSDNMDLALASYARCIELLEREQEQAPYLVTILIDRAMVHLQERQALPPAEADLRAAERIADPDDRAHWSDLHNAWASYYYQAGLPDAELTHRLEAWLAAVETRDVKRIVDTAHNLGQAYLWRGQYEEGLIHLQESRQLAVEAGNRQMVGLNTKTIGNAYFWQGDLAAAAAAYHEAYELFEAIGNRNWQAYVGHDLVEVYAERGEWAPARRYLQATERLAESLANRLLAAGLADLVARYPLLRSELNERQMLAVAHLRQHETITNKAYCELTGCSPATAARDLKELLQQGVVNQAGQGRATHYQLA